MTLLTVGLLSALAVWGPQSGRSARPLEVTVTGLPTDSPVSITLGNQIPNRTAGFVHHFDRVPVGSNDLTWVQGDRCSLSDCPGNACPSWCFTQTMEIQVEPGTGIHPIKVNLTPAPKRSVRITADGLTKPWDLTFKLGDVVGNAEDNAVVFRDITPGTYALEALVGRCPSEARGCWPDGECPAGCAAYIDDFIVPWGDDEYTWALELADPRPAPVVAARPSNDRDTRPAPVPTRGAATAPVTGALFSSWLASHDDWHRETAMAAERADKNYLGNWDGVVPPSQTGAATNISWYAAAAFCKSRGGLASVEAEPHRWSESASQPYVEWRVDAGKAAWRSSDGRSSSKGVVLKTSNGVTGFRCAE